MSVPKGKRSESVVQFIATAGEIHRELLMFCVKLPNRWTTLICGPLMDLSSHLYHHVVAANSTYHTNKHEAQIRVDNILLARSYLNSVTDHLSLSHEVLRHCHLERHYRKYGNSGYVLLFDFTDYFNSAPHEPIYIELARRIQDERICKLVGNLMENYGPVGMGLGSQLSQIEALMIPNSLDHYIKEKLHIKGYGRYMDDAYAIHHSKEYLEYCLSEIEKKCSEIGIRLNRRKTRIVPLNKGFVFLKTKFILTETGRVVRRANKETGKRLRRKMKTYRKWYDEGKFTLKDAIQSFNSSKGCLQRCDSYRLLKRLKREFKRLFTLDIECGGEHYIYAPAL